MCEKDNQIYNIKIVTNDDKNTKIEQSNNQSETYILLQNEQLCNQNKQLIIDMKQLETEKEEIDTWLDKAETDKNHMKNFIKTISQQNSLYRSMIDNYKNILTYKQTTVYIFVFFIIFNFFLICINVPYFVINTCWFTYLFTIPIMDKYQEKYLKNNKKYELELVTIEKNNDFLNDYIDNM